MYTGKERRSKYDQNVYGTLLVEDSFRLGVFRVNPRIYDNENGFLEPAWIYDRRNKQYQKWRENFARVFVESEKGVRNGVPESELREAWHQWDSRNLLKGMYIG